MNQLMQANIDGLVFCLFCPFAAIMEDPTDRIFECLNEKCGKRSCRECRVESHHPLTCEGTTRACYLTKNTKKRIKLPRDMS